MNDPATISDFEFIFRRILNLAIEIAVVAAFIMIVVGGFKYLTAGGDPKSLDSAKKTLTYSIFGLVALVGIWLVLKFISDFTGVDVTQFKIRQ